MTSEKPSWPEEEKKKNQTSVLPLLPTSPHPPRWRVQGRHLYWWSNKHLRDHFNFFLFLPKQSGMHLSPDVSLQISPSLSGNVLKNEFSTSRETLKQHLHLWTLVVTISSLCRSTPTSNTRYELRPHSEINLQPTQTPTLVWENLSGTEEHSCAVVTPTEFPCGAEAPRRQHRQTKALLRLPSAVSSC